MRTLVLLGGQPLEGEVTVQGSKNAVLPMMAASLLHRGMTELTNVPYIEDVFVMKHLLEETGAKVEWEGHRLRIDGSGVQNTCLSAEYGRQSRCSVLLLGALLARAGEAELSRPGGCAIGKRPIDFHIRALEALGARVIETEDRVRAWAANGLHGASITLPFPSVGATENAILAAAGAEGVTILCGCAREPEIRELCEFLQGMGTRVEGIGSSRLVIRKNRLHDSSFAVGGDRIAAGTCLAAVAAAGGKIELRGVRSTDLSGMWEAFRSLGMQLQAEPERVIGAFQGRPDPIRELVTKPFPGFPTDMQSLFLAVLCRAKGESRIRETIFEQRFGTVSELRRMGAVIREEDGGVAVCGQACLKGAEVEAKDLRGAAALAVAALGAEGETRLTGIQHMMRGYEDLPGDLRRLGARILA